MIPIRQILENSFLERKQVGIAKNATYVDLLHNFYEEFGMGRGFASAINQAVRAGEREARQRHAQQVRADVNAAKAYAAALKADHLQLKEDEVLNLNCELQRYSLAIEGLLEATLGVDDFFDLKTLHREPKHPVFACPKFERPISPPDPIPTPTEPVYKKPAFWKRVLGKKRFEAAIAKTESNHSVALSDWRSELVAIASLREELQQNFKLAELRRLKNLEIAKASYAKECEQREQEVAEFNSEIDKLISDLGYGSPDAIETYISHVFANSKYPNFFTVSHTARFDPTTAELVVSVTVPPPSEMNSVKAYRYVKKNDEIRSTQLAQKAQKDRYASAIEQVALRSIHEIFEADRNGIVKTVSIEVGTEVFAPATGFYGFMPLLAVAAEKHAFMQFNLSEVVPKSTLKHLGASFSKNPFALMPAKSCGVRSV